MSVEKSEKQFSGLRAIFWPIHGFEVKKFLPMAFMMFCALFNYTVLRNTKDSFIIHEIGGAALNVCKLYITLPLSMGFFILYSSLSNSLAREKLFYTCSMIFFVFFAIWGFILYPIRDMIMGDKQVLDEIGKTVPFFYWHVMTLGKWFYALYYAMAELWGSVVVSLLFWQFANQITRITEARRYYAMFGLIGNSGAFLAGYILKKVKSVSESIAGAGTDPEDISIRILLALVLGFTLLFMYLYRFTNKNVMTDSRLYDPADIKPKKKKEKLSLGDSLKLIFSSKYLLYILMLVVGYGVAVNLIEVTWKAKLKEAFSTKNELNDFFGSYVMINSVVTMTFMLIGQNIVRVWGWLTAAVLTPIVILTTGSLFFTTIVAQDLLTWLYMFLNTTPIWLAVWVGLAFQVFSKSTKYSLFDSTKEMAYIPLSEDLKNKGKAAVDVVGGRAGKSGGAFIQSMIISAIAGSAAAPYDIVAPYLYIFLLVIIGLWIFAVRRLSVEFQAASTQKEKENK